MVERVFLGEEVLDRCIPCQRGVVHEADVTASAKVRHRMFAALGGPRCPPQQNRMDRGVRGPSTQNHREFADHLQREGIQRFGTIQCDDT